MFLMPVAALTSPNGVGAPSSPAGGRGRRQKRFGFYAFARSGNAFAMAARLAAMTPRSVMRPVT